MIIMRIGYDDDCWQVAKAWHGEGRRLALALVVATWGSAPRPVGSPLIIDADGHFHGSVSGGCVEGAVIAEAMDVIAQGVPQRLSFGVADEQAWDVGLSCGGTIEILVLPIDDAIVPIDQIAALATARGERRAAGLLLSFQGTRSILVAVDDPAYMAAFTAGKSVKLDDDHFLLVEVPAPRLLIVGAVHISQHLVPMARACGLSVSVFDPREAFATVARFPDVPLQAVYADECDAFDQLDAFSAVVTLTHDPKIDDPALRKALPSPCFYVGALGSRKTHAKRMDRLQADGLSEVHLARLHAPVGLDIGAANPAEIAVSVLAEIVAALRGKAIWRPSH